MRVSINTEHLLRGILIAPEVLRGIELLVLASIFSSSSQSSQGLSVLVPRISFHLESFIPDYFETALPCICCGSLLDIALANAPVNDELWCDLIPLQFNNWPDYFT